MNRPYTGLCIPCRFCSVMRADLIEISIFEKRYSVRLINCVAEENAATVAFAAEVLDVDSLYLWIPAPIDVGHMIAGRTDLWGHIFIDSQNTLSEMLIRTGHAKERV